MGKERMMPKKKFCIMKINDNSMGVSEAMAPIDCCSWLTEMPLAS